MKQETKVSERFISAFAEHVSTNSVNCCCGETHLASTDRDVIKFMHDSIDDTNIVIGCDCEIDIFVEQLIKHFEPQIAAYLNLGSSKEITHPSGDPEEHAHVARS